MRNFHHIFFEGTAYRENGAFLLATEEGVKDLVTELSFFDQSEVVFGVHHNPPSEGNFGAWGWGSCLWMPSGSCPFGHHERPHVLLAKSGRGSFSISEEGFQVGFFEIPFNWLEGHHIRLAMVTDLSVSDVNEMVVDKSEQIGKFIDFLHKAKDILGGAES